jgi:hypothetical protein
MPTRVAAAGQPVTIGPLVAGADLGGWGGTYIRPSLGEKRKSSGILARESRKNSPVSWSRIQAAIDILDILVHDSAQRLHISAQRIIISLPLAIFSHMVAQLMHISAHVPQTFGHIGLMRVMHFIAISHISEQSCIMQIISADMVMPLFIHIIAVSLHIAMQL